MTFTTEQIQDGFRTAAAMARAADAGRPQDVAALWNSADREATLWALSVLPGSLLRATGHDPEAVFDIVTTQWADDGKWPGAPPPTPGGEPLP